MDRLQDASHPTALTRTPRVVLLPVFLLCLLTLFLVGYFTFEFQVIEQDDFNSTGTNLSLQFYDQYTNGSYNESDYDAVYWLLIEYEKVFLESITPHVVGYDRNAYLMVNLFFGGAKYKKPAGVRDFFFYAAAYYLFFVSFTFIFGFGTNMRPARRSLNLWKRSVNPGRRMQERQYKILQMFYRNYCSARERGQIGGRQAVLYAMQFRRYGVTSLAILRALMTMNQRREMAPSAPQILPSVGRDKHIGTRMLLAMVIFQLPLLLIPFFVRIVWPSMFNGMSSFHAITVHALGNDLHLELVYTFSTWIYYAFSGIFMILFYLLSCSSAILFFQFLS